MAEFPVEPSLSKMLLMSAEHRCTSSIVSIAAMLQVQSVFSITKQNSKVATDHIRNTFAVKEGDTLTLLNVYNAFIRNGGGKLGNNPESTKRWCGDNFINYKAMCRAKEVHAHLLKYVKRFAPNFKGNNLSTDEKENEGDELSVSIRKCIVSGFFANAAQFQADGTYKTIRASKVLYVHPSSIMFKLATIGTAPEWVVFAETILTTKDFMRDLTVIDPIWLSECAPHFYHYVRPKSNNTYNKPTVS